MLPLVASSPVLPPLGLLFFLCWQLLRTEMWPVWIGLPLGLWDDLFSGQPIGTAVGLWTLASIAIHYSSQRIYWRGFLHDWAIAALLIAIIQSLAALIIIYWGGVRVEQLGPLFGLGETSLGALSVPFTVFATVGSLSDLVEQRLSSTGA